MGGAASARRVDVALAIPYRAGRMLVARRPSGVHLGGMWEFPGGRVRGDEGPADAARRELLEETGLQAVALEPLLVVFHDYRERPLRLHVFLAREPRGEVRMDADREHGWKTHDELRQLEMPPANRQMIAALRWRLGVPAS